MELNSTFHLVNMDSLHANWEHLNEKVVCLTPAPTLCWQDLHIFLIQVNQVPEQHKPLHFIVDMSAMHTMPPGLLVQYPVLYTRFASVITRVTIVNASFRLNVALNLLPRVFPDKRCDIVFVKTMPEALAAYRTEQQV